MQLELTWKLPPRGITLIISKGALDERKKEKKTKRKEKKERKEREKEREWKERKRERKMNSTTQL